jgi:hypothetical protein
MPRWASRITLEVTSIRVERVQEISGSDPYLHDLYAEGMKVYKDWGGNEVFASENGAAIAALGPKVWFKRLWDSTNAKRGYDWDANPWVWVVEFKKVDER